MGRGRFQRWVGCNFGTLKKSCNFSSVNTFPPNRKVYVSIQSVLNEPPEALLDHGGRRRPTATLVPPSLHRACNNQPRPLAVVSVWGEAWQIALGCRYGSQRTPWWCGCRQDDVASNLRSKGKKIALSPIFNKSHFLIVVAR
jgi:hypothetical protein